MEDYFFEIKRYVDELNEKEKNKLSDFLGYMEQRMEGDSPLEQYKKYIKKFKRRNKILFITFKTKNINKLAHICKYILFLEWHNEWALAVAGQHTPTIFGWFD